MVPSTSESDSAPGSIRWSLLPGPPLLWRCWDDEWVLYHPASGDTHRLPAVSARVLQRLEAGPATAAEVVADLAGEVEDTERPQLASFVDSALEAFARLGLVEAAAVPCP